MNIVSATSSALGVARQAFKRHGLKLGLLGLALVLGVSAAAPAAHAYYYRYGHPYWGPPVYYLPPPVYYVPPPPVYYAPPPVVVVPAPTATVAPVTPAPTASVTPAPTASVTPAPAGSPDAQCQDYQTTTTVNGQPQASHGTACRQPDGTWKIIN
jgi:hypothetical protein